MTMDRDQPVIVTFIIPIRHQHNSKDWTELTRRLDQTCHSISRQSNGSWKALVVANDGAEIPSLPAGFAVKRVDFPPNELHEQGSRTVEEFHEAFRMDKGRRVLAGMLSADPTLFFMIVDDDDFISRDIVAFVSENLKSNGWYIQSGVVWDDGGRWVYQHPDFNALCGTSLIVRSDLYGLPASFGRADDSFIKAMLGSHIFIKGALKEQGHELLPLPFVGAVYRVGHSGAHSRSRGLFRMFVWKRENLARPRQFFRRLLRLRPLSDKTKAVFALP
jgi:hypothetical protein